MKKVIRALPDNPQRRRRVLNRISQDFGIIPKQTFERTTSKLSDAIVKKVQEFYNNDSISWQAPGKRDFVTIKENGIKKKYQKRHLLYNIREVYELFLEQNLSKKTSFSLKHLIRFVHRYHIIFFLQLDRKSKKMIFSETVDYLLV